MLPCGHHRALFQFALQDRFGHRVVAHPPGDGIPADVLRPAVFLLVEVQDPEDSFSMQASPISSMGMIPLHEPLGWSRQEQELALAAPVSRRPQCTGFADRTRTAGAGSRQSWSYGSSS